MEIISFIFTLLLLLSPLFFWYYIFQNFPQLQVGRSQFILWICVWALVTLPLAYSNFLILWSIIQEVFMQYSYLSESFLWIWLTAQLLMLFIFFFWVSLSFSYYLLWKKSLSLLRNYIALWFLIILFCLISYILILVFWNSSQWKILNLWDYAFQGAIVIFWYYIIVSLLEEWLKYIWNITYIWNSDNIYKVVGYACVIGLGFAFFENIFYSYQYYQSYGSIDGIFELIFFRSIFTVSVHILCAILLAVWIFLALNFSVRNIKLYLMLVLVWWASIVFHGVFNLALTYWYTGIIFLYIFMLYITVVYVSNPD